VRHSHERKEASPPLQLVSDTEKGASHRTPPQEVSAKPALAVWRLDRSSAAPLPGELVRRLIAHYSDPGDLVVVATGASEALRQARRLGRRALTLPVCDHGPPRDARSNLIELRSNERADLAIGLLRKRSVPDLRQLCDRLKPGAFIVLVRGDESHGLGAVVHACQQQGLQYWQHVVALDPAEREREAEPRELSERRARRCHRDLLVFRRDTGAVERASAAAAVAA
jgi:hypothetical protein